MSEVKRDGLGEYVDAPKVPMTLSARDRSLIIVNQYAPLFGGGAQREEVRAAIQQHIELAVRELEEPARAEITRLTEDIELLGVPRGADAMECARVFFWHWENLTGSTADSIAWLAGAIEQIQREAIEEAANVADRFVCGACGMDGKVGKAIRALLPFVKTPASIPSRMRTHEPGTADRRSESCTN